MPERSSKQLNGIPNIILRDRALYKNGLSQNQTRQALRTYPMTVLDEITVKEDFAGVGGLPKAIRGPC